ncbi:uncharacterized protein LOC121373902 isoform X2 [Gigantopelta aegis]|uniref:uncharacterized protein LOC121373902 isoform X2 n=1 Tax=Gigantopelta aegis TaxID=1735272 RepID=UPI001B88A729|nr:uncharacterized protein LOC121373902 isoform X2 [Gigantopelta aegis]
MPRPPRNRNYSPMEQPLQVAAASAVSKAQHRDQLFQHMQDIFKDQIEADVIHMVLAECKWEEGQSMDMLLSLCHDCAPQGRETTRPDLALIACSLIDENKDSPVLGDLEIAGAGLSASVHESMNITANKQDLKIEMTKSRSYANISPDNNKINTDSPTDDISLDFINPYLNADVKDITLQSYMSVYLNADSVCPSVPFSSPDMSVSKDEDNTSCVSEPLLTDSICVNDNSTDCTADTDSRNVFVHTAVDVIDRELITGGGNCSRCVSDKTSTDMFSLDCHCRGDTVSGLDKAAVHCAETNSCNSRSENSKGNITFSACGEKQEICSSTFMYTSVSETSESLVGKCTKPDVGSSVFIADPRTDSHLCSLETKVMEKNTCACSAHINSDHINCDEDSKLCESGEQSCLSSMKETISGSPADVGSVRDNPECEQCSEKGSNISLAHLSPKAPEFIPRFAKPSSQTYCPSEGSPMFLTPKGPQHRPWRMVTPTYPSQQSGFSHSGYRLPLRQFMLRPIPVNGFSSQSGAELGGLSRGAFISSGTSSGAYATTCSCTTTITTTSQALYSHAAMNNGSEPVLTSRVVESKESLATFYTPDEIAWVKRKYLDRGQLLMIILRGLPGSGKSTLARELKFDGAVLNTDEYFMKHGVYKYDINMLSDAHDWNKTRAIKAMQKKINPLIIDNTNLQMWEMIPYVKLALAYKYMIEIVEPSTPWKERPAELAKKNSHSVPKDSIKKMKQRYERDITVKKIIASVKAADVKEKQKATENVGSQNLKNNDCSFPCQKSSKAPHYPSPPTVNPQTMFSSYTTLLKSRNKGKENLSTKVKETSGSNNKTKPKQKRSKVIPSLRDFQSVSEKEMTDVDGKDREAVAKENASIVHNEKDFASGLENPNIGPDEDYSSVCKKPNFGHSQKDCVISTLEDLLSQGDIQNMTKEDWQRRKDELEVLLQLSPVDPTEKKEILRWLEYRMKRMRGLSDSSESEASTSHLICNNSSSKVQEIKSLRAEDDDDDDDDSAVSEPSVTEDYKSTFQKFQMEDNFLNVNSNITNQNNITPLNIFGMNNAAEEDNEFISRTAYNDKPTLESFTDDAFLSFVKDTTVDVINTDTGQYSLNIENSTKTNSKTNLSQINLNSDINDVKTTKQKDIKPPLLDVSSFRDFSENKESMLAKKQEVSDKGIHLIGSTPVKMVDYECCSLSESDTNLNIPCSEADTEKTWSDTQSSPVIKECSSVWDDDSGVNSSKPKREPRKKNYQVVDKHLVKNNETCQLNFNSEISTVPKFENEYWSSNVKNVVSEKCSISDEEITDWNLDGQKPKPQRERKYSERHSQSSDNTSQETFNTGSTEEQTEEEPSIEQQNIQSDDNIKTEIDVEDSCDDVGQPAAADSFNVMGVQVNSTDTEKFMYNFEPDQVEESYKNGSERPVFGDQEHVFESLDSCKQSTETLHTSTSVRDFRQGTDASSQQESASSNEKLTNSSKAETQNDETSDINDDTITSGTELLNAATQETTALGPAGKMPKRSKPKHKLTLFLNSSSKQKYETSPWSTFDPVQNVCSNVTHTEVKANKKVSSRTHWTLTTAKDFNVLDGLNRGCNVSNIKNADQYTILLGKDRSLNQNVPMKSKDTNDCVSEKLHVDKSTMTDDGQNSLESDIEFLKHSFPDMSENQLWEVMAMCQNDVEWSLNLLLDWGVHVPLTPVDKREIAEEMFKLKQNVSLEKAGPQPSVLSHDHPPVSPLSLFDLCSKLVCSKNLATLEEVQRCLIKDGRRRLERMESYGMERMLSVSHDGPSSEVDDFQDLHIQSAASSGSLSSSSSSSDMVADVAAPETMLSGGVEEEESAVSGVELESGQAKSSDKDGCIVVPVDGNLVQVLESLFGLAECRRGADDEFEVSLDLHTAKLIHSRLRRKRHSKSVLKQLKEDEALARRLQQEEKFGCVNQHFPISGLVIDVEPLHERGGVSTVHHSKKEEPVKLKDIMKEEKDKHILRIEQQRILEESGEHIAIATKLKRQKLYSIFPGVDENFLEEIFQANGFSLEDTVYVIQNCLGAKEKVKYVMTEDAMAEFDEKVLQQTKQLSMQTLMDSSSKTPSKDFQDVPGETDPLPSYSELRAEGTLHYQLRNDCFRKAQHAHQRGMKDVAYFYSQQGNLHTKKLKEAHMRASQKLLESRNHLLEKQSTLDLHGFHVGEAISTLQNILEQREIEFQRRPDRYKQSLVIVTGRGRHSQGGVPKVRPAVANFLNNAKYRYTEDQVGIFKVQLRYRSTVQ